MTQLDLIGMSHPRLDRALFLLLLFGLLWREGAAKDVIDMEFCGDEDCYKVCSSSPTITIRLLIIPRQLFQRYFSGG